MSIYPLLKFFHISCAIVSFFGFSLRGYWMLQDSPKLQARWVKLLPHAVDTLLLITAIALVVISRQYPLSTDWITLKLGLLLLYIGFGSMALKRGRTRRSRLVFLALALFTISAIFTVAVVKPGF